MITKLITTKNILDDKIVEQWNSVIPLLDKSYITGTTAIEGNIAYKYKGDLFGLFLELGINRELIYPFMKINGYDSSDEYDGTVLQFRVLDTSMLTIMYNMFTKS